MLQEHWLYDSQCHVFEDRFREVSAYCVSGMNENCLTGGRGYGGCAILWRSSLSCTVEPINLDNNRVCAIQVKLHDISFMLCCVYMPCDTTYDRSNIDIYIMRSKSSSCSYWWVNNPTFGEFCFTMIERAVNIK